MLYLLEGGGKAPLQICLMRFLSGDGTQVRKVPLNSLNSLDGSIIPALWRLQLSLAVLMLTLALPPVVSLCFFLFFPCAYTVLKVVPVQVYYLEMVEIKVY